MMTSRFLSSTRRVSSNRTPGSRAPDPEHRAFRGAQSAARTSLYRYFEPSTPSHGPSSYSSANVPLNPASIMMRTDRRTSLSFQRFQYLAWTFVCEYGASAFRPLYIRYSCSQLQKSGDASQNSWCTSSRIRRMFIGLAVNPQWFSSVTLTPAFPP